MKDIQTLAIYSGFFHDTFKIRKKEGEEVRIKKIFEEERKKIQPIYNSQGKIIKYNEKNLDIRI